MTCTCFVYTVHACEKLFNVVYHVLFCKIISVHVETCYFVAVQIIVEMIEVSLVPQSNYRAESIPECSARCVSVSSYFSCKAGSLCL